MIDSYMLRMKRLICSFYYPKVNRNFAYLFFLHKNEKAISYVLLGRKSKDYLAL